MSNTVQEKITYNRKTGEVTAQSLKHLDDLFDDERGYLFWSRKKQARIFPAIEFPTEMTVLDIGRMTILAKYAWSKSNMLGCRRNGGLKAYSAEELGALVDLKPRQARNFIKKMIQLEIIADVDVEIGGVREKHYYLNPLYYFNSRRISLELYTIFHKQLDPYLPDWVKERFGQEETFKRKQRK